MTRQEHAVRLRKLAKARMELLCWSLATAMTGFGASALYFVLLVFGNRPDLIDFLKIISVASFAVAIGLVAIRRLLLLTSK